MELILASSSPYRRQLLATAGIPCQCQPPHVDEASLIAEGLAQSIAPGQICQLVARAKAQAVARQFPHDGVLGSDQMLLFQGEIWGKPGTPAAALAQLERLSGQTHQLLTAFTLITPENTIERLVTSTMTMRPLGRPELERYLAHDEPWDCAGSYRWEARGITLFESVETEDPTAIIGLPLIALTTALRACGFAIP